MQSPDSIMPKPNPPQRCGSARETRAQRERRRLVTLQRIADAQAGRKPKGGT